MCASGWGTCRYFRRGGWGSWIGLSPPPREGGGEAAYGEGVREGWIGERVCWDFEGGFLRYGIRHVTGEEVEVMGWLVIS